MAVISDLRLNATFADDHIDAAREFFEARILRYRHGDSKDPSRQARSGVLAVRAEAATAINRYRPLV
jgi:hypothetical protein